MKSDQNSHLSGGKPHRRGARVSAHGAKAMPPSADAERSQRLGEVGSRIAAARQNRGWTQAELGTHIGKSRGTIVLYEQGKVEPPLGQIEALAKALEVSPELLAFGRQGITGLPQSTADVVSVPEASSDEGVGEESLSGAYGLTEGLVRDLGIDRETGRIVKLSHGAPAFGLADGDRIIVNRGDAFEEEDRLYALRTRRGLEVVRLVPNLSTREGAVKITDGRGITHSYERRDLEVLGRVVGSIRGA